MKILVCGTQCNGKSTFVNDFIGVWPMYKKAKSYRELLELPEYKDKILLNKDGTPESQELLFNVLLEQQEQNKDEKYIIFDRGILDNLVYSMWLYAKNPTEEMDLLIRKCINRVNNHISYFDIIFWVPLSERYPVKIVSDKYRDTDPTYRREIDNIFRAVMQDYYQRRGFIFPLTNCPGVIEIEGDRIRRLVIAGMYINEQGDLRDDQDYQNLLSVNNEQISDADTKYYQEQLKQHWNEMLKEYILQKSMTKPK